MKVNNLRYCSGDNIDWYLILFLLAGPLFVSFKAVSLNTAMCTCLFLYAIYCSVVFTSSLPSIAFRYITMCSHTSK